MKKTSIRIVRSLAACALLHSLSGPLLAWEPNAGDLDRAISGGDFSGYLTNLSSWLGQQVPADPAQLTHPALTHLIESPVIAPVLAQRQFIAKVGPVQLAAFAKADAANKAFLTWILRSRQILELWLEGATPMKISAREDNSWSISTGALEIWKKIYLADPGSHEGIPLKLAMATALRPPGTGAPGSGQQKPPSDPLVRYKYFKTVHANHELFPSFDKLTVWDMQFVVCSGGSEADLTWGREMVNTWRPDFRVNEKVVDTTSQVWRRNSPVPHVDYKAVLDGGGKCGPRSSWSVFICQAFGIPAIGVGQPAHACVAYKAVDGHWQVAYGRGWNASHLEGMSGPEFVEGSEARLLTNAFTQVEHMRWLAAALPAKQPATAVLAVANSITQALAVTKRDLAASEKPNEAENEPGLTGNLGAGSSKAPALAAPAAKPEPPYKPVPGVIHVDASSYFEQGGVHCYGGQFDGVPMMDSFAGGKQLHFQASMASAWVGYKIEVPATGTYQLSAKLGAVNSGQILYVRSFGAMLTPKQANASIVYRNMVKDLGPQQAIDNNPGTRWAVNENNDQCWLDLDLGKPTPISTCMIDERAWNRVSKFNVLYKTGNTWKPLFEGTNIGIDFHQDFPPVTTQYVRLNIQDCRAVAPTIWEFSVGTVADGRAWIEVPLTNGLWQMSKPVAINLTKGSHTLWFFAPFQRGVSFKSFDLKRF